MDLDPAGFAARLRGCRVAAGLSQEELAHRSGLSVGAIRNLERGRARWPYQDTLQRLADGLELRDQARAAFIAAAGRRLGRSGAAASGGLSPGGAPKPRQLPAAVAGFTGRQRELAHLSELLSRPGGTAVVAAIDGTAGVGKTALAVHWAHLAAAQFPDGQLFVNLRGFDPSGSPVRPDNAVRALLEALGVTGPGLPATAEAQFGLYRTLLTGRRILIVLDNARDEAHVRPLLPGSLTCRTVVTSRNQLTGLVATDAARPLTLDVLTSAEAYDLLRQRLGHDRLQADGTATTQVIEASARLPLALAIVAARCAMQPELTLTGLAASLYAVPGLDGFSIPADAVTDVRAVLSWSYRQLSTGTARAYRLASLHPGANLDRYALAALCGTTPEQAGQMLGELARGHLVQPAGPDRYGLHDLLRRYTREQAARDSDAERGAALTQLLSYYLQAASAAMDTLFPADHNIRPRLKPAETAVPDVHEPGLAQAWLDAERANLIDIVSWTAAHGRPWDTITFSAVLFRYLSVHGCYADAVNVHQHAASAAHEVGDLTAEADALAWLGFVLGCQAQRPQALACFSRAVTIARDAGHGIGEARALNYLAQYDLRDGRYTEARERLERALALYLAAGQQSGAAYVLSSLGVLSRRQGDWPIAVGYLHRALDLFRGQSDLPGVANVLHRLGFTRLDEGNHQRAAQDLRQALAAYQELHDRQGEASVRSDLGRTHLHQGHHAQAAAELQLALTIFRDVGDLEGQAAALNGLGETLHATGSPGQARSHHAGALKLAKRWGDLQEQARAHRGLGQAHHDLGQPAKARQHWRQALRIYTDLAAPEAEQVRATLAHAGDTTSRDQTPA